MRMRRWGREYDAELRDRYNTITTGLGSRINDIVEGRVAPAVEDIAIGSARKLEAAVLFFDIRQFTAWSGDPSDEGLRRALLILDCVIPMMMHVLHDCDAYVEKNTGDGVMAIFPASGNGSDAVNAALSAAPRMFYAITHIVNPSLAAVGLGPIKARIGIDYGAVLIARIGVASGTARLGRNALVAVGPPANIACRLQTAAGTNEILIGNAVYMLASARRKGFCKAATPADWSWVTNGTAVPYWVWRYGAEMLDPDEMS